MASNPIPNQYGQVMSLARDMVDGLHRYETVIGVKQNTEAKFLVDIAATDTATMNFSDAKKAKKTLGANIRIADSNMRAFIKATRAIFAQKFGEHWNQNWQGTNWPGGSTAVPGNQAKRSQLCTDLKTYLTKNPTMENAPLEVTAAKAGLLFDAMHDAHEAWNDGVVAASQKRVARDAAMETLRVRMRALIQELTPLMDPLDPRWDAFGLDQPGAPDLPEIPENLIVTTDGPGVLLADWPDSRRANYYRIFIQVVDVDEDFRHVINRDNSDVRLTGLPTGKTVKFRVTAANDTGESQPSEDKEIVVL
ncbi:MAG: fibronectin type III domain-containing protein [Verrucomicrobiota bacterium]